MKIRQAVVVVLVVAFVAAALAIRGITRPSEPALPAGTVADRIVVDKSERTLKIFRRGRELKTYAIALGRNPEGPKQQEGDGKTPEGVYRIDFRKEDSTFHRALHISYPTREQRRVVPNGTVIEILP
jgi:murein L,D-transpeptidase YafK